jgi:hypothetical protein
MHGQSLAGVSMHAAIEINTRSGGDVPCRWSKQLSFGRLDSHAEVVKAF